MNTTAFVQHGSLVSHGIGEGTEADAGGGSSSLTRNAPAVQVIGYASVDARREAAGSELRHQADLIERECRRRGLELTEIVREREPASGKALARPGLTYALERISSHDAMGLAVYDMSRLTRSAAELGRIIELIARSRGRLLALADGLDTNEPEGRFAAALLVQVSRWEAERLSERTRHGLRAARLHGRPTGRPSLSDYPDLSNRIAAMRAQGMSLQAIADRFNAEGVPTVRGGTKWRHSSIQQAAGYRRPSR